MKYGYFRKMWQEQGIAIPIELDLHKYKHLLLTGGTGTGKSYALLYLLGCLLKQNEIDVELTICDFKNSTDFDFLSDYSKYYYGDSTYDGIMSFYERFTLARQNSADDNVHILIIDEYPAMLTFYQTRDKSDKTRKANDVLSAIAEILMLGRGLGFGIWLTCQRSDNSWFQAGSRDNLQVICALGNISREQRQMLFSGYDTETESIYGPGEGICLADGKELVEVKFPLIEDIDDWKEHIRQELVTSGE